MWPGHETRVACSDAKMAESSSASAGASAAGSDILDLELAGTNSDSSFDEQETTDEQDTSQMTTSEASSSKVVPLLDGLRAAKKSELTRKRKIFTNPSRGGTCKQLSCSSNPKSVTPSGNAITQPRSHPIKNLGMDGTKAG